MANEQELVARRVNSPKDVYTAVMDTAICGIAGAAIGTFQADGSVEVPHFLRTPTRINLSKNDPNLLNGDTVIVYHPGTK